MLIILSGSSGAGKNTIIERLFEESDKLKLLPTMSTRKMRSNESMDNPYRFVSWEEFERAIAAGEMVEYCEIHGNLYGVNRIILQEMQKKYADRVLIKDIDVEGTVNLMRELPSVVGIFLTVSKEELRRRLIERGEKDIDLRLGRYDYEQEMSSHYKYVLTNNDIDKTMAEIRRIVREECAAAGIDSPL